MSADSKSLPFSSRTMAARDLARDFVATAQAFADTFVQCIASQSQETDSEELQQHRRESCAALWATIVATFEASALSASEKARVVPLVRQEMLAAWNKFCANDPALLCEITERSPHYLRDHDRGSQLTTATNIMKNLLESIDPKATRALPVKRLAAMVAHRMLSDLRRLNELKLEFQIE
jgi:hypothetical protein